MLGFDRELRRRGFAGNSCQIVLELDRTISRDAVQERLGLLSRHYAILRARPGGILSPRWKPAKVPDNEPQVRVQADGPGRCQEDP